MVAESDLMSLDQKTLENDFKIAVCGMNTASQWYAKNADKSDNPLLLLTSGVLHEVCTHFVLKTPGSTDGI